jgi:RimJ/RimL family protein N-acetyltransferase
MVVKPAESKLLKVTDPFRSRRLLYRGIEDNDEDKAIFDEKIQKDPVSYAYCGGLIQRPQSRLESDKILSTLREYTLAVYICLPSDEGAHGNSGDDTELAGRKEEKRGKKSPTVIGMMTLDGGTCGDGRYSHQHRHLDLEIFMAAQEQDKGYGTEAVNWGLDWAFRFAGVHRVYLCTVAFNERASHVYEKVGFKLEGRFREHVFYDRRWWDLLWYSMLEHEWEELRREDKDGP